jgi:ornithine cyclodeaminase/alanine dehydrogenase-like protein (mu-crystallin family)
MFLITDEQVRSAISVRDCLEVVELAYRDLAAGEASDSPRERIFVGGGLKDPDVYSLSRLCGAVPRFGVAALRITSHRRGAARDPLDNHIILLFDVTNGRLSAILQGFTISGLRLGATTALPAKYLAPAGASEIGVFGSGKQARTNLEGIAAVTSLKLVKVYSPNPEHCRLFAEEMEKKLAIPVVPQKQPTAVVKNSGIVLCASNAWEPVFDGKVIEEGALVISLRNSDQHKRPREFDDTTIARSSMIIVCSKRQMEHDNQAELLEPLAKGLTSWEKIYELTDLVTHKVPARSSPKDIVFYHSNTGSGIQFAAVGYKVVEILKAKGGSQELPDEWFFTDLSSWWEQGYHPTP